VVVGLFGTGFPFVDGSTAAFGADEVLGGDLLGEHAVLVKAIAEDGEAASVALRFRSLTKLVSRWSLASQTPVFTGSALISRLALA